MKEGEIAPSQLDGDEMKTGDGDNSLKRHEGHTGSETALFLPSSK
jgi:hypothetical protein